MLWNGMITSLQIGMFRYCLKASEQLKLYMLGSVYLKTSQLISASVMLGLLGLITAYIFYFLFTRRNHLNIEEMIAKCGNLYGGIKVKNNWQLFRFPAQLAYILVYASIISTFVNYPGLQVILMI